MQPASCPIDATHRCLSCPVRPHDLPTWSHSGHICTRNQIAPTGLMTCGPLKNNLFSCSCDLVQFFRNATALFAGNGRQSECLDRPPTRTDEWPVDDCFYQLVYRSILLEELLKNSAFLKASTELEHSQRSVVILADTCFH
jgi:hypothetical protein